MESSIFLTLIEKLPLSEDRLERIRPILEEARAQGALSEAHRDEIHRILKEEIGQVQDRIQDLDDLERIVGSVLDPLKKKVSQEADEGGNREE